MSRRRWLLAGLAAAAVIAALAAWWWLRIPGPEDDLPPDGTAPPVVPVEPELAISCNLYFPGGGGLLYPEAREIADGPPEARARSLVEGLLAGPTSRGLWPPLPSGVSLGSVYVLGDGRAFVELRSEEPRPPASGSLRERQMVYSLVDTVVLNLDEVDRVVLLWNGQQPATFAGHLDTARPLAADSSLIAR